MLNETESELPLADEASFMLTEKQQWILGTLTVFSGVMSFFCSTTIVYLILRVESKNPYQRILLGLSISDMIASFSYFTGPFLMPTASPSNRIWAFGNDATCSFGGFLTQLGFLEMWYNGFLSFYYLATVRFGVPASNFARKYEPWIHISTWVFNIGGALLGLLLGVYGELPMGTSCWVIVEYPEGCTLDDSCTGETIGWIIAGFWGVFFFLAIIINNLVIYRYVNITLSRTRSATLSGPSAHEKRLKAVAIQGFLYVGSFLSTYSWTYAIRFVEFHNSDISSNHFWMAALDAFFLPSQGCVNILIYHVRPEYQQFRKEFPDKGRFWILFQILRGRRITSRLGSANFDLDKSRRSARAFGRPGGRVPTSVSSGPNNGSSRRLGGLIPQPLIDSDIDDLYQTDEVCLDSNNANGNSEENDAKESDKSVDPSTSSCTD